MIRGVLTLPDRMISRRAIQPGYKWEAVLVVLFGALGAVGTGYVGAQALNAFEGSGETLRFEFIGGALQPFAGLLLLWVGFTVVPHLLSGVYGGRGPMNRLFRGAAWSLIPIGIWMTLRSAVTIFLFLDVDFPGDPEGLDAAEQYQSIMELGLEGPIYLVMIASGVLFAVWSGYLLSIAVAKAKDISTDDARKVAAIPSGVVALFFVWMLLGAAGIL